MYYCHTCNFANGEGVCVNCVLISGEKNQKISRKNVQVIKLCKTFTIGTQTQEYKAST